MNHHLILDFETLSKNQHNCIVIDCAAFVFDFDRLAPKPYRFQEILEGVQRFKLSFDDQKFNYGYKTDPGTVEWWSKQAADVKKRISPKPDDIDLKVFGKEFCEYVRGYNIKRCWARGIDFDSIIIRRLVNDAGYGEIFDSHLQFWKWVDTRSFIDGASLFRIRNDFIPIEDEDSWNKHFQKHNSSHDIAADILRIQKMVELHSE